MINNITVLTYPEEKTNAVSSLSGKSKVFKSLFVSLDFGFIGACSIFVCLVILSFSDDGIEVLGVVFLGVPFSWMLCHICSGVVDICPVPKVPKYC